MTQQDDAPTVGVLDTNAVIYLKRLDPATLPDEVLITAITLAELTVGPLATDDAAERAERQSHLQMAEADFDALPFTAECARQYGRVAAALRAAHRKTSARSYDALIAATAIAHGLPLYTSNTSDFEGIPGLDLRAIVVPEAADDTN